jgi:large subunit ribosomal protein L6
MRDVKNSKKVIGYNVKVSEMSVKITSTSGTQILKVPRLGKALSQNRFFFKTKAFMFLFKAQLFRKISTILQLHFKKLILKGIGFKCHKITESILLLKVGYTHKIYYIFMHDAVNFIAKRSKVVLYGSALDQINNIAYEIRSMRKPDDYKGKGIVFSDEKLRLKSTKKRA